MPPTVPKLNETVTVGWQINRQNYTSAKLNIRLKSGNLFKYVRMNEDLSTTPSGSVSFIPTEGEALDATVYLWSNSGFYTESTGDIPLQGNWNAVPPIQTDVNLQAQQTRGANGTRIIADYTITGGSDAEEWERGTGMSTGQGK